MSQVESNENNSGTAQTSTGGSDPSASQAVESAGAAGAPSPESKETTTSTTPPAAEKSEGNEAQNGKGGKEAAAEGEKKEEAAAPPAELDLKLPEGSKLEAEHLQAVKDFARQHGLTQAQAQAILERDSAYGDARVAELKNLAEKVWPEAIKADVEIAGKDGSQLARNLELAKHAANHFMTPELKKTLDSTGLGNHPELIKTWAKIGRAMADDSLAGSGSRGGSDANPFDEMYPSMKGK